MGRASFFYRLYIVFYFIIGYVCIFVFSDVPRILFQRRKKIAGQVVVITGGAMGIGKEVAKRLSIQHQAKVCILDINEKEGLNTLEEIHRAGGVAQFFKCDVSNYKELDDISARIRKDPLLGAADMVIANAAILKFGLINELKPEDYELNNKVNYLGHVYTVKAFLPQMIERNQGHIVSIGSICSHFGDTNGTAYCSAKFACRGFMEALHADLLEQNLDKIALTSIYPYFVRTSFISQLQEPFSTFWNVIPLEVATSEIVDSILYERLTHFIPNSVQVLCVYLKWMTTKGTIPMGRKAFNVQCKPRADHIV